MNTPMATTPAGGSLTRLVGRCRNCGGRKRARDRHRKYCEDCRISLKIPKRDWMNAARLKRKEKRV